MHTAETRLYQSRNSEVVTMACSGGASAFSVYRLPKMPWISTPSNLPASP